MLQNDISSVPNLEENITIEITDSINNDNNNNNNGDISLIKTYFEPRNSYFKKYDRSL